MNIESRHPNQRFFIPEVVQTSAMDCGPAALKAMLEGFGISAAYGRLREACQTDVDGTSIDTLEDIAVQLGLQAEQVMLPADHLILPEAQALPAIVVVRRPSGMTHFLVVWNRIGSFVQVMDPATGRRWPAWHSFQNELYIHSFPVPAQAWREWAGSEGLISPLRRRLTDIKVEEKLIDSLIQDAQQDPGWRSLAILDAATRMVAALVRSGGLASGPQASKLLERFFHLNRQGAIPEADNTRLESVDYSAARQDLIIPTPYWSVLPIKSDAGDLEESDEQEQLLLRGAVLVRVTGKTAESSTQDLGEEAPAKIAASPLSPDLEAALKEPAYRPEKAVWEALRQDGLLTPALLGAAIFLATLGVLVEALLLQGILMIGQNLNLVSQRIAAGIILLLFVLAPLLLEFPLSSTILQMGRRLETRLRIAFLEKLPRLGDRYFRSRLASDMTQRAYDLRQLRMLPNLGVGLLRTGFQLILTMIGVIWLDAKSAPLAIIGTIFFMGLSLAMRPLLEERDLRLRTHIGALSRFYLDALLGLVPAKTHGAERSLRRQHETQMFEWVRAGRDYNTIASFVQAFGALMYSAFSVLILINYVNKGGQSNEILLLFYWTLSLPTLGQALVDLVQQYPMQRNRILRLLEPLGAPDEEESWFQKEEIQAEQPLPAETLHAAAIDMEQVEVQAGGHTILKNINLHIQPGEHIAIIGPSGAGKSSLIGLLLGWHRPASGRVLIDNQVLDGRRIQALRRCTAWVDPAVQLWNRSLYDNLRYGSEYSSDGLPMAAALQKADLYGVLERLPDGLKSILGEGGGLVSGGEGQRVRLGRAILHANTRLVLLDEPFRGLDREKRRKLLVEVRQCWQTATLLCITHDVSETLNFSRVLVIENGQIVEDGSPKLLAAQPGSRYSQLLQAEEAVRQGLWASAEWQRLRMESGQLFVEPSDNR